MINAWAVYAVRLSRCRVWIWPCRAGRIKKDHFGSGHLLDAPVQFRGSVTPISVSGVYTQTQMQGSKQSQSCFFPPLSCLTPLIRLMKRIWVCEVGVFLRVGGHRRLAAWFHQLTICIIWLWRFSVALHYRQPWKCLDPAGRWRYSLPSHWEREDNVLVATRWEHCSHEWCECSDLRGLEVKTELICIC